MGKASSDYINRSGDFFKDIGPSLSKLGLVLSGGGSRAAYQVGALKALVSMHDEGKLNFNIIVGASIGAINGITFSALLKQGLRPAIEQLEQVWLDRTFRSTFSGSPSRTFLRALKIAFLKYARKLGPEGTTESIFDPTPLMNVIDNAIATNGGLESANRAAGLDSIGVMTTVEGAQRKPLFFLSSRCPPTADAMAGASFEMRLVDTLSAKHGMASAALPSVLPPVSIDIDDNKVRLVDGGISQNIPVDPAVRLGATHVIEIDVSGRDWWQRKYSLAPDIKPEWEVPAGLETFCMRPPKILILRCQTPLGPVLKEVTDSSRKVFASALGPTWPVFTFIRSKFGEDIAYEVLSYAALHPEYARALIALGERETRQVLGSGG